MRPATGTLSLLLSLTLLSCGNKQDADQTAFTQEDFVTAGYLAYQDSLVQAWNLMINDDNRKLRAMHELLAELRSTGEPDRSVILARFEDRLKQLHRIRYTQKSMRNADVIEEYDFASGTLVREVLAMTEVSTTFATSVRLQNLVDDIRLAEARVSNYRADYDDLVSHYNSFVDVNKAYLRQLNRDSLQKRPLFQMVSIE